MASSGQDGVDEVRGPQGHAPAAAAGAHAAALAREGDEALGLASAAAEAGEAVREDAAAQVGAELALDEARDAAMVGVVATALGALCLEVYYRYPRVTDLRTEQRTPPRDR